MKKLLKTILWSICLPTTFLQAQTPDSTLVFETKEVAGFKKQSIVEEYQVPYEQDVNRKWMYRIGIQSEAAAVGLSPLSFVDFQYKIGKQNSLLIGAGGNNGNSLQADWYSKIQFRHFIGMRKRIEAKKQRNNFNGRYIGLDFSYSRPYSARNLDQQSVASAYYTNTPYLQNRNTYAVSYGIQLGTVLDFALQAGLKDMQPAYVNNDGFIVHADPAKKYRRSPFIGTRSALSFSFTKKKDAVNCDFVNCYRETNKIWKFSLDEFFYADFQSASLRLNLEHERRIINSSFTWNSTFLFAGQASSQFMSTGDKKETGFLNYYFNKATAPTFFPERQTVGSTYLRLVQDVRYYCLQKRQIAKGKGVKNLNGLYIDVSAAFNTGQNPVLASTSYNVNRTSQELGLGTGFQTIFGSNYYVDFAAHFYPLVNMSNRANEYWPTTFYFKSDVTHSLHFV